MFSKIDVNNENTHPIFTYLRANSSLNGADIPWNFGKFLLSKTGEVIEFYSPKLEPFELKSVIEENL